MRCTRQYSRDLRTDKSGHVIKTRPGHISFQCMRAQRPPIRIAEFESAQVGNTLPMAERSARPASTQS